MTYSKWISSRHLLVWTVGRYFTTYTICGVKGVILRHTIYVHVTN